MFKLLKKLIYLWGDYTLRKNDTYTPNESGYWKNVGTVKHERWTWVEPKQEIYQVSISQLEDEYLITVGHKTRPNTIDTISCNGESELNRTLDILTAYYGTLGRTTIDRQVK